MILFRHIILTFFFLANLCYADTFGYLKEVEVSICMDECSQYMLVDEDDNFIAYLINTSSLNLSYYIGRYIQVGSESEEQYQCITGCSAIIIETINLSDECTAPVQCFADPCFVAPDSGVGPGGRTGRGGGGGGGCEAGHLGQGGQSL